ncbi:MAG: ABC transporter permease [Desulfobacterales bacterium]|nr:ABC transporter permease [Desulfobacterales bacterium]
MDNTRINRQSDLQFTGETSLSEKLGPGFWLAAGWILIITGAALCAGIFPLPPPDHMNWMNPAALPGTPCAVPVLQASGEYVEAPFVHIFGTDQLGRDILTRMIFGARVSLAVGLVTPLLGLLGGGVLGMLAGFYRGRVEAVTMALMDAILAFPGLVLLLMAVFYFGASLSSLILVLGFLTVPAFTRVARANTLTFAKKEFVVAARAMGQSDAQILILEILPNILIPLLVYALLVVSYMIVAEGALSFLGLGVPPPAPSWGEMISQGKEVLEESAHISLVPACVMFLTVLSFNVVGDAVRTLIDKRESCL